MDALKKTIGPAPSELSMEELVRKVEAEQRRVGDLLVIFRSQPVKNPRGGRKTKAPGTGRATNKDLKAAAEEMGVSVKEFIELAKKMQKKVKTEVEGGKA